MIIPTYDGIFGSQVIAQFAIHTSTDEITSSLWQIIWQNCRSLYVKYMANVSIREIYCTCIHVCMYVYMYACMYVCTYISMYQFVLMYGYMYACKNICMYILMSIKIQAYCILTYIHTFKDAYLHTYIFIHTCIQPIINSFDTYRHH